MTAPDRDRLRELLPQVIREYAAEHDMTVAQVLDMKPTDFLSALQRHLVPPTSFVAPPPEHLS